MGMVIIEYGIRNICFLNFSILPKIDENDAHVSNLFLNIWINGHRWRLGLPPPPPPPPHGDSEIKVNQRVEACI